MSVELYRLPPFGPGRLGAMPRPRGNDWLEDEIRSLASDGVDILVSLLTQEEIRALDLQGEEDLCGTYGIAYVSFPIADRGVPASKAGARRLVQTIAGALTEKKDVAIHCRAGIGRSAVIAACTLIFSEIPVHEVFDVISRARGVPVPDTPEQVEWVEAFVHYCRLSHDDLFT